MDAPSPLLVAEQHRSAVAALTAVIDAVEPDAWDRPSPCQDWAARDVLGHLIETERSFLGTREVGLGPAPELSSDPAAAWRRHVDEITPIVTDDTFLATPYEGYFGPTTAGETWQRFYVFDMVVHRWDLATATGLDSPFSDDEIDRIEAATAALGDNIYMEGVCRAGVEAPAGADRQTKVLATLGRSA